MLRGTAAPGVPGWGLAGRGRRGKDSMKRSLAPPGWASRSPFALWRDPIGFLQALAADGDRAHFRLGPYRAVLLTQSQDIERVLLTDRRNFVKDARIKHTRTLIGNGLINSEGAEHLRNRLLVQPAFRPSRLVTYAGAMADEAALFCDDWADGATVDAGRQLSALTLRIVGRVIFGADVSADSEKVFDTLTAVLKRFGMVAVPFSEALSRLPMPGFSALREAQDRLNARAYTVIRERRASIAGSEGDDQAPDLLTSLLMARGEDGAGLGDEEVHDEAMTVFLAGHETTATALAWCCYLLARRPDAQRRVASEVDAVCGGGVPCFEHVSRLKYTQAVFMEALRLYPPIWLMARSAEAAYAFPSGIAVRAGTLVVVSPLVQQTHPAYWQAPREFRPERWETQSQSPPPRYAYVPFGAGPRACVGEHFANLEAMLILATIFSRWTLTTVTDAEIAADPLITLRPRTPIILRLSARGRGRGPDLPFA